MTPWAVFIAGLLVGAGAAGLVVLASRRRSLARRSARLSRLAHDLRTPLASIAAYGEILADAEEEGGGGAPSPSERRRFLGILNEEARRLGDMIDAHLGTSRPVPEPARATGPPRAAAPGRSGRTVLVVDDDRFLVEATRTMLAREGFEAIGAGGGEEALSRARGAGPDIILMDLSMPGMGGDEALRRLRSDPATRDIPVIITTGEVDGPPLEGAAAVLVKPVTRETLLAAIERAAAPAPAAARPAGGRSDE